MHDVKTRLSQNMQAFGILRNGPTSLKYGFIYTVAQIDNLCFDRVYMTHVVDELIGSPSTDLVIVANRSI